MRPTILETNASGELKITARVLGTGPHARFRLEHEGQILRLIPEAHCKPDSRLVASFSNGAQILESLK